MQGASPFLDNFTLFTLTPQLQHFVTFDKNLAQASKK
ncbi:MAG: hypothetical protein ACI9E1_001378 [Cryomorphaceae bacterium]|jgi:hypothetical protein